MMASFTQNSAGRLSSTHKSVSLSLDKVVVAVLHGLRKSEALAAVAGHKIRAVAIITAMLHTARSREVAELAARCASAMWVSWATTSLALR